MILIPKQKIPAAINRLYGRVFVCMRCNAKIKADAMKVSARKIKCRKCGYKGLRQKSKELKV